MPNTDFICPVCGTEVFANAKACPECGADDRSGWREDAGEIDDHSALNLTGDDDFDYDKFVAEEFGSASHSSLSGKLWWIVAIILLLAFLFVFVLRGIL
ncbi:MAG: hypothetical protein P8J87_06605 [Verrucomicrobiales bacterium]|nr:hypothetical protein [Verrucomicrobiales bacterium]